MVRVWVGASSREVVTEQGGCEQQGGGEGAGLGASSRVCWSRALRERCMHCVHELEHVLTYVRTYVRTYRMWKFKHELLSPSER